MEGETPKFVLYVSKDNTWNEDTATVLTFYTEHARFVRFWAERWSKVNAWYYDKAGTIYKNDELNWDAFEGLKFETREAIARESMELRYIHNIRAISHREAAQVLEYFAGKAVEYHRKSKPVEEAMKQLAWASDDVML